MKEKSLKINAILNAIKTLMSLVFPLITFPYSSRVLGPSGIGKVSFASSIVSYFSIIAALGIGTYGSRELAKIRNDEVKVNKFVREIFIIHLISTSVAYILFFFCIFVIPSLQDYRSLLLISCTTIIFSTIGMDWVYSAMEDYLYITIRSICFQILGVVLLFVLVKNEFDIIPYALLSVITSVGSNILNFIHVRKYVKLTEKTKIELKYHLKPIFILFGTIVAVSLYTILDTTMLGFIIGDEEVGIYNAATKINRIVVSLIAAVGIVASPRMSNYAENDSVKFNELLKSICNFYIVLCAPCAAGLCLLSSSLVTLFCGEKFVSSIPVMQIMCFIVVLVPFGAFFSDQIFTPLRKDKYSLIPVLIGAAVNIVANIFLIPLYGAIGAAFASVFAEFIVTGIKYILVKRTITTQNKYIISIMQSLLGVICMVIVLLLFNRYIVLNPVVLLVLDIFIGAFIYYMILLLTRNTIVVEYTRRIIHK